MKRILSIFLILLCLFSLTACMGFQPVEQSGGSKTQTEAPIDLQIVTLAPEGATDPNAQNQSPADSREETQAPATEAPEGEDLTHGTVEDGVYVNESLNLQIAGPEGWIFYDEEQIAAQNNLTMEAFEGTDMADAVSRSGQMMDMMVIDAVGNNANLMVQPAQALLAFYSDEQLYTLLEDTYRTQLEGSGMSLKTYEVQNYQVFGEERPILHLVLEMQGRTMDEYQLWIRDNASYTGILTLTLIQEESPQPFFDGISHLN